MADLKVAAVFGAGEPWLTKDGKGPFTPWQFKVEGNERIIEWSRKEGSPGPSVGETLTGELEDRGERFPLKFKKAQGGGGFGSRSPEEKRRIERMACHKSAVQLTGVAAGLGLLGDVKDSASLFGVVAFLADKLEADLP